MSSHETHVAAHRKPVLFAIISWAGEAHRPRRPNPFRRVPCDGPTGSKEAANCAADYVIIIIVMSVLSLFD